MAKNTRSTSFSLDPSVVERLEARVGADGNRSVRLTQDLDSYYSLLALGLARAKRRLNQAEAKLCLDVQNGTLVDGSQLSLWLSGGLAHQVGDGIALDGLDKKWGVDGPSLIEKIIAMPDIEVIGLLDWAARFWGGDIQADDAVEKAVADFLEDR